MFSARGTERRGGLPGSRTPHPAAHSARRHGKQPVLVHGRNPVRSAVPGRRHARVDPIMALASRELKLVCMYMNVGDTAPTSAAVI